ncbi:hypothetical protein ACFSRY_16570 [Pontibacter locisalis]|uniref:YceI-like domain-containing protein n=1 Tax=Pontibacter locisalis TaxID=1719035 RepID=A0ABW5IPB0_9BACT
MRRYIPEIFLPLLLLLLMLYSPAKAQTNAVYTGDNRAFVTLDGITKPYTFTSDQMLVKYNKTTQRLECILDLATLYPANDSTPPTMAYDVFFGAKYPDLVIYIDAPVEKINARNLYAESMEKKATVTVQGVANQTVIPVVFTPDKNSFIFSTNFDLMLDDFEASIPIKYIPVLSGRVVITINNARWIDMQMR